MSCRLGRKPTSIIYDEDNWQANLICIGCGEASITLHARICGHHLCTKCNNESADCKVCIDMFAWWNFVKDINSHVS